MLSARAVSPVVGTALLLAVTLVLASVVVVGVSETPPAESPRASFTATADADTGRISVTHTGGESVDVDAIRVVVTVNGTELRHQPPVPFFSASGFAPGPTGPFNTATDQTWTAGESASLRVAGTNHPALAADSRVVVTVYSGELVVGRVATVARG
ncbi:type IV pilin [Haloarchaeobius amylolyticus]|uniref:type IV pilin n=1 Tax=Haloarchaeobius amylolyticus TaxID=1198296 RepID=UPI00226DF452